MFYYLRDHFILQKLNNIVMQKNSWKSEAKLRVPSEQIFHPVSSELLPSLSFKELTPGRPSMHSIKERKPLFSLPSIEKSKKNMLLMRKINPLNRPHSHSSSSSSSHILKRLQSGKQKQILPQLQIIKPNQDKRTYLKQQLIRQCLVGQQAVNKFYQRYKQIDRRKEKQDFMNQKHALTSIVSLLQMHNFTPRKLSIVKLKGEEAILDLNKLGIGQGTMGPVVTEIVNYLQRFQEVDLSYNRIDALLGESLIEKLGKTRIIDLSHNRIGKVGCQKFSDLFRVSLTRIQVLNLQQNNLLDNAGVILIQNLIKYGTLKKLNLSKNYMSNKFAAQFKQVLYSDRYLVELYLSWNQFNFKACRNILEGVAEHTNLRIFDFSWNKIQHQNSQILAKIFQESQTLVHADFSFCQISLKSIALLSKALHNNHTLYGLHFEGNSAFIDHRGFLINTERQYSQYPLPIIKGVIRKIDGIKPNQNNQFKGGNMRDVCWICHSWQQKLFDIPYPKDIQEEVKQMNVSAAQCYIHFKQQNYTAVKMFINEAGDRFQVSRMCPIGPLQFFFTFFLGKGIRRVQVSPEFPIISEQQNLNYFIGKIQIKQIVMAFNNWACEYDSDPIDELYEPNIGIVPRSLEVGIGYRQSQKVRMMMKRKVIREEKVKINLKDVDGEDDDFLKDKFDRDNDEVYFVQFRQNWCNAGIRSYIQDYIRRCIDFDVDNSKINKIIKDKTALDHFKIMMLRYYRHFKDAFYYLSKDNPSILGIYSITQLDFIKFVEEQKYVTKRVTQAKILLKLYACLAAGEEDDLKKGKEGIGRKSEEKNVVKLLSRPQFLQFLVRLAVEKWCSFVPAKKKKEEINKQKMWEEQEKRQLQKRKSLKGIKKDKNSKIQKSPRVQKQSNKLPEEKQINKQQIEGDDGQQQQLQMKKFKLKLPLPLLDGLQRTMATLYRFAQNYRSSTWRKRRYLKIDILIVLKAYEQIITSLYDKYTESKFKTNKPKKLSLLLTLEELRTMIMDADIKRTKEAMKQIDQAFLDSKRLEVEDGNMQFGLTIQQFQQCLARLASQIWFNPASASKSPMWDNQINRKCTPLFIRLQSFIIALYWRVPQIHNKRLTKIAEKGIFELQIELIMQKIQGLAEQMGSFTFLKRNSMQGDSEISLKDINDELREKYDKMVIHHEHEEQYETYVQHH